MNNRIKNLELVVGRSKGRLSAKRWINRLSDAIEKRPFPPHRFILVPGDKREELPR